MTPLADTTPLVADLTHPLEAKSVELFPTGHAARLAAVRDGSTRQERLVNGYRNP